MIIIGVDPGVERSGIALFNVATEQPVSLLRLENAEAYQRLFTMTWNDIPVPRPKFTITIEKMVPQGRTALGHSTFETIRVEERLRAAAEVGGSPIIMISRSKSRTYIAGPRGKEKDVRLALIERFGAVAMKNSNRDSQAALAVAVTVWETQLQPQMDLIQEGKK